jgi:hypothetical protein
MLQLPLMMVIPFLVRYYLKGENFTHNFRVFVIIGGIAWVLYGNLAFELADHYDNFNADDYGHLFRAKDFLLEMDIFFWDPWLEKLPVGNRLFQLWGATIMYFSRSEGGILWVIHGFFGFWGGLTLARMFSSLSFPGHKNSLLFVITIFLPTAVFWSTRNMKEPLLYWSVCQLLAATIQGAGISRVERIYTALLGWLMLGIMRPPIAVCWGLAAGWVTLMKKGLRLYALVLGIIVAPLLYVSIDDFTAGQAFEDPVEFGQRYAVQVSTEGGRNRAAIDYSEGGAPIPFVSGFVSTFFRPFFWKMFVAIRVLGTGVEIWTMTLMIVYGWWQMKGSERRRVLKAPPVRAALIAVVLICLPMSFIGNEGAVSRYRIQVFPAIVTLAFVPFLQRKKSKIPANIRPHFTPLRGAFRSNA